MTLSVADVDHPTMIGKTALTVFVKPLPTGQLVGTPVVYEGTTNGVIKFVNVSGGAGSFTYSWRKLLARR